MAQQLVLDMATLQLDIADFHVATAAGITTEIWAFMATVAVKPLATLWAFEDVMESIRMAFC